MSLIKNESGIIEIEELFNLNLVIPEYQRPYSWSVTSTNTLFVDTYKAFEQGHNEYRLGSVILHSKDEKYNIVDGQQRLTTLSILFYCLGDKDENKGLLKEEYNSLSKKAIIKNLEILRKKVQGLSDEERENYKLYLLKKCKVAKIVTDEEQEAFQFFDSQNSRGKELEPHDLLKSYHLREMNNVEEKIKAEIIESWENKNYQDLRKLFETYLFPLTQWYKGKNGLGYSSKKIAVFKGVKVNTLYNYAIYQKAANLFIEQANNSGMKKILVIEPLNQFQLTQPLISGERFFSYTGHYADLLNKIQEKIKKFHKDAEVPNTRAGDIYVRQLYECTLLFFADRFGIDSIKDSVMKQLYTWCYSIRVIMKAVYPETINKYAIGKHEKINQGLNFFSRLSEMQEPEELNLIIFEKIGKTKIESKYEEISKILQNTIQDTSKEVNNG